MLRSAASRCVSLSAVQYTWRLHARVWGAESPRVFALIECWASASALAATELVDLRGHLGKRAHLVRGRVRKGVGQDGLRLQVRSRVQAFDG